MEWQFDNNKPIYIQLIEYLKFKIISGELQIGSRLESVRTMAEEAEVNPNTMQRALSELEREGLVYSQRTKGRFVTEDKSKIEDLKKSIAKMEIEKLREILNRLGYDEEQMIEIIIESLKGEK
ncbi:GntR family transcriptional regulator [Clostridioides mangenotii]|uniref:GntR family transcriptional regulator n=1 Tax=Metaclostridioides mangenotii TaxID=1540 RepID=UPI0018D13E87|nr:GntR family transcriptional regulator [Clostridioides mangenotii]MBH0311659.1 GntR family transcriptional regulator [Alcaligenes faecalis]MBU5308652.1 GntR family transcriptional regulator [Clostridioides mangenotii]MCR1954400.1 GntR family transcriptional regulator [Clostridioides mangenotii]